ncbi:hypothetical protein ACS81_20625, partial [Vibrio parahaemolyticus]
ERGQLDSLGVALVLFLPAAGAVPQHPEAGGLPDPGQRHIHRLVARPAAARAGAQGIAGSRKGMAACRHPVPSELLAERPVDHHDGVVVVVVGAVFRADQGEVQLVGQDYLCRDQIRGAAVDADLDLYLATAAGVEHLGADDGVIGALPAEG